ncbi:MAG TPA: hypothetical protein VL101_12420 [Nordella sp.]|nr:hypothetical protein [Nordella sp.]
MSNVDKKNIETRHERSDRIARELMSSERQARERKTARLRALRLEMEKAAN